MASTPELPPAVPASATTDCAAAPRLPLSAGQVRAIYDVMRTFRDDDLARAADDPGFQCARCGRDRALAGSLRYGGIRLCNGCATDYELLRTAGMERDLVYGVFEQADQGDRADGAGEPPPDAADRGG